ncbi:GAF domain-containing protein [Anaerolineales bacterium HSG25]|nr:GAF domain-containing protein [Anaerolineales bacterium HSG25]
MTTTTSTVDNTSSTGKKSGSIRWNILKWTLPLTLIPLLLVGAISIGAGITGIQQEVQAKLQTIASLKTDHLDAYLRDHEGRVRALAADPMLNDYIQSSADSADSADSMEESAEVSMSLSQFASQNPALEQLTLLNSDTGETRYAINKASDPTELVKPLVEQIPNLTSQTRSSFYFDHDGYARLAIVSPVIDSPPWTVVGWITPFALDLVVQETDPAAGRVSYLLAQDGSDSYLSQLSDAPLTPPADLTPQLIPTEQSSLLGYMPDGSAPPFPGFTTSGGAILAWLFPEQMAAYQTVSGQNLSDLHVVVEQSVANSLQSTSIGVAFTWGIFIIGLVAVGVIGLVTMTARTLANPIIEIAEAATAITKGDRSRRVTKLDQRDDEIGELARDFNIMTSEVQAMVDGLESNVAARTKDLNKSIQQSERRAYQLETNALLNKAIAPIFEVDQLNEKVVQILQERFGFYYIALFLTRGNNAELSQTAGMDTAERSYKAASSTTGGRSLLGLKHLELDKTTLIGRASRERKIVGFPAIKLPESSGIAGGSPSQHEADGPSVDKQAILFAPSKNLMVPGAHAELAIPLLSGETLVGVLDVQSDRKDGFKPTIVHALQMLSNPIALAIERANLHAQTTADRDRTSLLYDLTSALTSAQDINRVLTTAIGFTDRLGAQQGLLYFRTNTGDTYQRLTAPWPGLPLVPTPTELFEPPNDSTIQGFYDSGDSASSEVHASSEVRELPSEVSSMESPPNTSEELRTSEEESAIQNLKSKIDKSLRASHFPHSLRRIEPLTEPGVIYAPIGRGKKSLRGFIALRYSDSAHADETQSALLKSLAWQIGATLENLTLLTDVQHSLQETHLMLETSGKLSEATSLDQIYQGLTNGMIQAGANYAAIHLAEAPVMGDMLPDQLEVVYQVQADDSTSSEVRSSSEVSSRESSPSSEVRSSSEVLDGDSPTIDLADLPHWQTVLTSQESVSLPDVKQVSDSTDPEQILFSQLGVQAVVLAPLLARRQVLGVLMLGYNQPTQLSDRALSLFKTLSHQATIAIESAHQSKRTQTALAETQTLYRAGRVLARASHLREILEEALIEFLYSLGLEQGGITMLTDDRKYGMLTAYVQDGLPNDVGELRFAIVEGIPYQEILLAGQPFVSVDVPHDPRLPNFKSFNNEAGMPKSLLQAPMIVQGETIGWIGADSVQAYRSFSQREIDLARAMADQIAIGIQNRKLLEQTQRRAAQLKAVAQVGEAVSEMIDLQEILSQAVDLIKERFKLYHVSIFVVDEQTEWAVVKASTGEVGQIMVNRPHRLKVGSNSIVGYVTANARPRIALDVGEDAVWFNNPLLPQTRSEMALPLLAHGGLVMGALDVQSVEADAFGKDDIEILQIMADQLTAATEKANLFEQTQRRLLEQATLFRIGSKLGATLDLTSAAQELVRETAESLSLAHCWLAVVEGDSLDSANPLVQDSDMVQSQKLTHDKDDHSQEDNSIRVIGDFHQSDSPFPVLQDATLSPQVWPSLAHIAQHQEEQLFTADGRRNEERYAPAEDVAQAQPVPPATDDVLPDDLPDNRVSPEVEFLHRYGGTMLGVIPVILHQKVVGYLLVADDQARRKLHRQDIALLNSIALQAANAIQNTQLYQRTQENQQFLRAILNQIPDPIFIKNPQRALVVVNQAFAQGVLGQPDDLLLGLPDDDYYPAELAESAAQEDARLFETARPIEQEQVLRLANQQKRTLYVRKTPLWVDEAKQGQPDYLLGVLNDITEQRLREMERERLMDSTRQTLRRTQALYQISHALDTSASPTVTFEVVLGEYLRLLEVASGTLLLLDTSQTELVAQAQFSHHPSAPAEQGAKFLVAEDRLFAHLVAHKAPITIKSVTDDPLTTHRAEIYGHQQAEALLVLPLLLRQRVGGLLLVVSNLVGHRFSNGDIELGQTISGQLARWLENKQLLTEAEYRATRLTTAAKISQAASSMLSASDLISASVALIREQFDYYYVGLFLVEGQWAVLKAGTGEAGQRQLDRGHQLKLGGGSMIGWSVENRQAKIALDVGAEAVHFKNPDLPLTRSEMALPLLSRDEALGALTIQSVEARAFSDEDITLLQTMADQLANAIKNAHLFTQTQAALSETERLYQITQELLTAEDEEMVYRLATHALAQSGVDLCRSYVYQTGPENGAGRGRLVLPRAGWSVTGQLPRLTGRDGAGQLADLIKAGPFIWDATRQEATRQAQVTPLLADLALKAMVLVPLESPQRQLGFILVGYQNQDRTFSRSQLRYYNALAQQMVVALENLRLLNASQKRARREEIIREISGKIRGSTNIEDILQTTVTELSKVVGTNDSGIRLGN